MRSCVQNGSDIAGPQAAPETSGRSPFLAAIAIVIGVGTGAVLSTGGTVGIEDLLNGGWLSRPTLAETQRQQAAAIAALEKRIGAVATDAAYLDLRVETVAKRAETALTDAAYLDVRIDTVARRSEEGIATRVAALNGDIAALKTQAADVAALKNHVIALHAAKPRPATLSESLVGRVDGFETGLFDMRNGVSALRSSVHDLAVSHRGEIAALTHRLDKLETVISSEATGSIRPPAANGDKRSNLKAPAQRPRTSQVPGLPLQILGHIVDVKEGEVPIRASFAPERD
jgi:hypothetical protein